ncbi:Flap endonuclease 1-A [Apostasia shenzhenica]|uniref:Flap endonuclease 1 n=1 Tax=Apostasia shenzhenica TaxID=1088818 RepID=A0A2I0B582_9ASPA|nr:Flap endonuclease 1-A [Apostasia shenzhenica]
MGIKGLTKLLADNAPKAMKEQKFESYFGRKIAIDASMSIYQFLIVVGRVGNETLTNEAGEVTSHLQGMFTRTIRLLEAGIKPTCHCFIIKNLISSFVTYARYVFDGQPPDLKKQELAKRYSKRDDATKDLAIAVEEGNKDEIEKFSKRTVKVTKQHNEDCKQLLRLMGVPIIEAPCEAEAQCASLCQNDKVYAVASEDMDSLTFGAPRFLRHLMDPSSKKIPVMEFEVAKVSYASTVLSLLCDSAILTMITFQVLEELGFSMDQFIDLCILCGCDYCDSIKGIGGQTALKLIRQHGSIENVLENLSKDRYHVPEDWPYQEARRLFKEPSVILEMLELKWVPPDEEGLVNFLVKENGFNQDRVVKAIEKIRAAKNKASQGRLESFFKPVLSASEPLKRKDTTAKPTKGIANKKSKTAGKKK